MIDYRFELQYTISLFVMVFAAISAGFTAYNATYEIFFAVGILQMVALTATANYERSPLVETTSSKKLPWALDASTVVFSATFVFVIAEQLLFSVSTDWLVLVFVPMPIAIVASIPLLSAIRKSRFWRSLTITVSPQELRIYDKYDDDSVSLHIKNATKHKETVTIRIARPTDVEMMVDGQDKRDATYQDSLVLHPNGELTREFFLKYNNEKNGSLMLNIEFVTSKESIFRSVKLRKH